MEEPFVPGGAPLGLAAIICDTLDMPDIRTVEGALKEHQRTVREIFARVIG
jgi:hypothetical protein